MEKEIRTRRAKIHDFLENPQSLASYVVQYLIVYMILMSVAFVTIEVLFEDIFEQYKKLFVYSEYVILTVFTIEYVIRFITAPRKWQFFKQPLNVIDFMAVFLGVVELLLSFFVNSTALRVARIFRFFRLFKLVKYGKEFSRVFKFRGTILQSIVFMIVFFLVFKGIVWFLEFHNLWFHNPDLNTLFTVIGFAVGVMLSQKIGTSHAKYIEIEKTISQLFYGMTCTLVPLLNGQEKGEGDRLVSSWFRTFFEVLSDDERSYETLHRKLHSANQQLYEAMATLEPKIPAEMIIWHRDIAQDSGYCLLRKHSLTPKAYDGLLNQLTLLYVAFIAIFTSGFLGMVSVAFAAYTLYGMYKLTLDLDSIFGGEENLINVDILPFENFVSKLEKN